MNYTKGEWKVRRDYLTFWITTDAKYICELSTWQLEDSEIEANAHLIAAAPEMYEALSELLQEFNHWTSAYTGESLERIRKHAKEALAKAEVNHV